MALVFSYLELKSGPSIAGEEELMKKLMLTTLMIGICGSTKRLPDSTMSSQQKSSKTWNEEQLYSQGHVLIHILHPYSDWEKKKKIALQKGS